MRNSLIALTLCLTSVTILATSLKASGQDAPSTTQVESCPADYLNLYGTVAQEVQKVATYVRSNEIPPNLKEAAEACSQIESQYPEMECKATADGQIAATKHFAGICSAVHQLYIKHAGGDAAASADNQAINDNTALTKVPVGGLNMKVLNAGELQKALAQPKSAFIIEGRIQSLIESILSQATVRCTFVLSPVATGLTIAQDENLQFARIVEGLVSGVRYTRALLTNNQASIDCTTRTGQPMTLLEFKSAFNGLLEVSYTPAK